VGGWGGQADGWMDNVKFMELSSGASHLIFSSQGSTGFLKRYVFCNLEC
jgi:hypothetical protein